jgi:hypothetical protein
MHRPTCGSKAAYLALALAPLALVVVSACGSVTAKQPDAGGCETPPTQETACADKCGDVTVCGASFTCGGCAGELMCGAQTANTCGCASSPCAVASVSAGDVNAQTLVDVAVDANGNVFAAGNFRGTITFGSNTYTSGATRSDMFVVKLSPTGDVLWSNAFGDAGTADNDQQVSAIDVDAVGNLVLVGYAYASMTTGGSINLGGTDLAVSGSDMVIAKYDPMGNHIFSAVYGTDFTIDATAISIDRATQDILVTGRFWKTLKFGALASMTALGDQAYFDIFLVRFSANGTPATSKRYGDGLEQIPEALATSGDYVYLSAYFTGAYDYGTPNTTTVSTTSFYSLALTKLGKSSFAHAWTKQYGTEVSDTRLAADTTGNVFLSGVFGATLNITTPALDSAAGSTFLAKIDTAGTTAWAKQFKNISIEGVATGADGSLYVAGYVTGDVDLGGGAVTYSGSRDPFIAHYAADGAHVWSRVFAAAVGNQSAVSIAVAPGGTSWVGYNFDGTIDFGMGSVTTQGATDIAIAGYAP